MLAVLIRAVCCRSRAILMLLLIVADPPFFLLSHQLAVFILILFMASASRLAALALRSLLSGLLLVVDILMVLFIHLLLLLVGLVEPLFLTDSSQSRDYLFPILTERLSLGLFRDSSTLPLALGSGFHSRSHGRHIPATISQALSGTAAMRWFKAAARRVVGNQRPADLIASRPGRRPGPGPAHRRQ
jgi:hypothetical protein